MEEFLGADLVSRRFLALTRDERLLFSPNLDPHGLKALTSPHGLVLVAVAGTIHRDAVCLGIFEQIFGLIRSPLDNNSWKIKFVNLKIRGQDALSGTDVAAPALTYNSSELQLLCSWQSRYIFLDLLVLFPFTLFIQKWWFGLLVLLYTHLICMNTYFLGTWDLILHLITHLTQHYLLTYRPSCNNIKVGCI